MQRRRVLFGFVASFKGEIVSGFDSFPNSAQLGNVEQKFDRTNCALLGKLSNPEISCIVEKLEIIEENFKSLSWMTDGPVCFEREIAKLNRDIASKSDLADHDQTFQEGLKKVEKDSNARFEKMQHALKDISLFGQKFGQLSNHET
jgi:hypothetical protein